MSRTAPSVAPVLRFDNFELDPCAGELRKRGIKLRLQGQPLQVLAILVQSHGNLVTREELRKQLWPADTFVDFDHSLHNAIARIREALGDSAQTPTYIETLPRRGYRFIAPVDEVPPTSIPAENAEEAEEAKEAVVPAMPVAPQGKRRILLLALVVCCVVALAAWVWQHRQVDSVAAAPRSIAVLPLQNLSGDPSQEYFADAMTEELITELSRSSGLRVISHTSVREYKDTKKHLPQISRELKADDIVEGSVLREGDQVRVTVQLLDAPNDRHIWSEDYQRPLHNILNLQREVAEGIAQQIRVKLAPEQTRVSTARTVDPAAYDAYLRGRFYVNSFFSAPQSLNTAAEFFEQALRLEPQFSPAYAGLAETYITMGRFRSLSPQVVYRLATESSRRALDVDQNNGEAHMILAWLSWQYDRDPVAAERGFNETIALVPSYDCARAYHALFLAWRQRRNEALAEVTRSREINPGLSFATVESAVYLQLRDYPALVEASRKGVASDPAGWMEHYFLGVGYESIGKRADAIPEYQKAIMISGGDQDATAALAHVYAVLGRNTDAERVLHTLQSRSKENYISPYLVATIYAGLGEKAAAFKLLEDAYQQRSPDLVWYLKADPRIDNLRAEPQFKQLLDRTGFYN